MAVESQSAESLAGRSAAITGAGSGIGRAISLALARAGCHVFCTDIDVASAGVTAAACRLLGVRADSLAVDAGSQPAMHAAIDAAERWAAGVGGVSIFVANAGVLTVGGLDAESAVWEQAWRVNTMQSVYAAQRLVPLMSARGGGSFVVIASAAGLLTQHGALPYAVSKAAAVAVARWIAVSHGSEGSGNISVSCVCPQAVLTGMTRGADPRCELHAASAMAGADGVLSADEVADAVVDGVAQRRFLVLPHPSVARYVRFANERPDSWIARMQQLKVAFKEGKTTRAPARRTSAGVQGQRGVPPLSRL
jgi:NAD(P)-dependent dehydrogenase (short-subunit alcohol dehydrogenase family)